jgi:predicted PurR-regulated permease PerM
MKEKIAIGLVLFSVLLVLSLSVTFAEMPNNQTAKNLTEKNASINETINLTMNETINLTTNETINLTTNETINLTMNVTQNVTEYFKNTKGEPPSEDSR